MMHLDLSPPHSVEAEQGVLGGLMLVTALLSGCAVKRVTSSRMA